MPLWPTPRDSLRLRIFAVKAVPRTDFEVRIAASVLDRLIDHEPDVSREPPASRASSLRELKQAVRRDLEWLLNTRQCIDEIPDDLKELKKSVLVYGLPDFSQANVKSPSDQARLRRVIVEAIRNFEPRLSDVRVTIEPAREVERALHFRIDALLRVDPVSEPVTFDTTLHLYNGEYEVKGG